MTIFINQLNLIMKAKLCYGKNLASWFKFVGTFVLILCASVAFAQQKTVKGTVTDMTGEPIIGANVTVKGTTLGTITDIDGNFTLEVPANATLLFSFIGYTTAEQAVGNQAVITQVLREDSQALEEVVVVGYGVQKKVNMTGSISNVKASDLNAIPNANLSNTLAGRAPGLNITGNSGLMGASSEIRMRGGFGDPLIVIDGIIRDMEAFNALEPNEIDQLSFLKDAATASIYGSAAGNGVILVTTKGGNKNQKATFNYQGTYSISSPTQELFSHRWTATDELKYQNAVADFKGTARPNGDAEFKYFENRNYDVNDYIWQSPWNTKHSLSATGGTEKVQYYVQGSFLAEEGSYKSLENKKYSLRSNLTAELTKAIKMNVNISGNQQNDRRFYWPFDTPDDFAVYDIYRCTFNALKTTPFYTNLDGTPADHVTDYPIYPDYGSWLGWNPVDQVIGNRWIKTRRRTMNAIVSFDIDLGFLVKGLSTKVMGNYISKDYNRKKFLTFAKSYKMQQADPTGNRFLPGPLNLDEYSIFTFSNNYEHLQYESRTLWSEQFNWFVNYANTFGKHDVSGMVVFEQASNGGEVVYANGEEPTTNLDQMYAYSTDAERRWGDAYEQTGGRLSWIGRFNYNYDQKYIAEFSFRYDGNTLFPKNHRWGFFPSVSLAWRISQEAFMEKTQSWLSNLKIRASYGTTGNDLNVSNWPIAPFSYQQTYEASSNPYIFGTSLAPGIVAGTTPSLNLTWATSTTYNFGVDFGLFENKLTGSLDAFYRKETDILGARTLSLPSTYGATLAPENYAERSWRGAELEMRWQDKAANGQIDYSIYGNLGYAKDRWDKLDESAIYKEGGNLAELSQVGKANGILKGYIADHLLTDQAEVDALKAKGFKQFGRDPYLGGILYKDTRGDGYTLGPDGKIDSNDAQNLLSSNPTPRINYGFGGSFKWKGLSVDLHFQGVMAYDRFVGGVDGGFYQHGGAVRPYFPIWTSDKVWSPENPTGVYPRIVGSSWYESGAGNTTFWMRNGAYLRLKNVNIGYELPKSILRPIGLTHAQVFANATNLFAISAVTEFLDPEQKYYDSYPLMRTFSVGLNFSF